MYRTSAFLQLTVSWWIHWHALHFCFLQKKTFVCSQKTIENLADLQLKASGRFLTLCHVWLFFWQPSILKPGSYGNAFTPLALLLDSPSLLSSVCLSVYSFGALICCSTCSLRLISALITCAQPFGKITFCVPAATAGALTNLMVCFLFNRWVKSISYSRLFCLMLTQWDHWSSYVSDLFVMFVTVLRQNHSVRLQKGRWVLQLTAVFLYKANSAYILFINLLNTLNIAYLVDTVD